MHSPSRERVPVILLASVLAIACISTACLCGGSAKPDVDEVTRPLAKATQDDRTVTVSYRRTNRRKKQHMDQLFADDFYTITEAIWLESPSVSRFTLAVQSNRDGKVLMENPRAKVSLSPQADRVACKIGDGPWRVLFLVNDDQWLRAPDTLDSSTPPDWSKVPSLPDYTLDLYMHYDSQGIEDLDYSPVHRTAMLEHYGRLKGEEALVDLIFEVKDHPTTNPYGLERTINALSPKGRALFDARLGAAR